MRAYKFKVEGSVPPKKGMDLSMFGKPGEVERIIALRKSAYNAIRGEPPLEKNIRLQLVVHVGPTNSRTTGDLDNFVTGVCDSLMAATSEAKIALAFDLPGLEHIHPTKTIAIQDDCEVIEIIARKVIGDTDIPWYEVILEGE